MSAHVLYANSKHVREVPSTSKVVQLSIPPVASPRDGQEQTDAQKYFSQPNAGWMTALLPAESKGPSIADGTTKDGEPSYRTAMIVDGPVKLSWKNAEGGFDSTYMSADAVDKLYNFRTFTSPEDVARFGAAIENGEALTSPSENAPKSRQHAYTADVVATSKDGQEVSLGQGGAWSISEDAAMNKLESQNRFKSRLASKMSAEDRPNKEDFASPEDYAKAMKKAKQSFVRDFEIGTQNSAEMEYAPPAKEAEATKEAEAPAVEEVRETSTPLTGLDESLGLESEDEMDI